MFYGLSRAFSFCQTNYTGVFKIIMIDFHIPHMEFMKGSFLVGGSIRDMIAGRAFRDYDLAVFKEPERFARKLASKTSGKLVKLGKPGFELFRVISKDISWDVSPAKGNSIEEDLMQRDFTLNAMAVSLDDNQLIDPFGGEKDIHSKIIRQVSDHAFADDPLRMARGFRIAGELDFSIEPDTLAAISQQAHLIRSSPGERITEELSRIFALSESSPIIASMAKARLLFEIFPELLFLQGCAQNQHHHMDAFDHVMSAFGHMEAILNAPEDFFPGMGEALNIYLEEGADVNQTAPSGARGRDILKWSILLHDIGKPPTRTVGKNGAIHFYGHESKGAEMVKKTCDRLKCSNRMKSGLSHMIQNHLAPLFLFISETDAKSSKSSDASKRLASRFFIKHGQTAPGLILHSTADILAKSPVKDPRNEAFLRFARQLIKDCFHEFLPKLKRPPILTGKDLIAEFGLEPSPLMGKALAFVNEKSLCEDIKRPKALELAARFIARQELPRTK